MLNWPAIIKHADDAELIYVRDQAEWENDADLHAPQYAEADCLIDSAGAIFALTTRKNGCVKPEPRGDTMLLQDFLGLVKAHAAQQGSCCVAKLYAPTMADAFRLVESLHET